MRPAIILSTLLAFGAWPGVSTGQPPRFRITEIGVQGNETADLVYGISPDGAAVGYHATNGPSRAFVWRNGNLILLQGLSSQGSGAESINGSGFIVGSAYST